MTTDKPSVLRETDEDAKRLARQLLRGARHAALAVLDPQTGFPLASRVLVGSDMDGAAVILVSALSAHTTALDKNGRCSLLAGEPGKGDPLAHPRLSVQCLAERVAQGGKTHMRLRRRFLSRHPKTGLYIDFPDFGFFRLRPQSASLIGGFARAYALAGEDFFIPVSNEDLTGFDESSALEELNGLHPQVAVNAAFSLGGQKILPWNICGVDNAGYDLRSGDNLLRNEFKISLDTLETAIAVIINKY